MFKVIPSIQITILRFGNVTDYSTGYFFGGGGLYSVIGNGIVTLQHWSGLGTVVSKYPECEPDDGEH